MNAYILTLLANLCFALGAQFFTHYSRKFSSTWMNTFKALVAAVCFFITISLTTGFHSIGVVNFLWFFVSGFVALGIGDIFLLKAFEKIGPGRTMVIFGFHPVIVGVLSYFILSQSLDPNKLWAVFFFMACLFIYSYESFIKFGKWEVAGVAFAFLGMTLDGCGVLITRYAFDLNSNITAFEGNLYRCLGALLSYLIIRGFSPFYFRKRFRSLNLKSRSYVILGALFGTFFSLALYLSAIQKAADLAVVSAISITSVIFSTIFESVWERKWPSKYLFISLIFFTGGMLFIFDVM